MLDSLFSDLSCQVLCLSSVVKVLKGMSNVIYLNTKQNDKQKQIIRDKYCQVKPTWHPRQKLIWCRNRTNLKLDIPKTYKPLENKMSILILKKNTAKTLRHLCLLCFIPQNKYIKIKTFSSYFVLCCDIAPHHVCFGIFSSTS